MALWRPPGRRGLHDHDRGTAGSWPGKEGQWGSHPNGGSTVRVEGAASVVTFHDGEGAPMVGGEV
jgi:hypothetical protein